MTSAARQERHCSFRTRSRATASPSVTNPASTYGNKRDVQMAVRIDGTLQSTFDACTATIVHQGGIYGRVLGKGIKREASKVFRNVVARCEDARHRPLQQLVLPHRDPHGVIFQKMSPARPASSSELFPQ